MKNMMDINGYRAVIAFDPDINMFRGEFMELNGGADFYADTVEGLRKEGELSLKEFLALCKEKGIPPTKSYSGKLQVRFPERIHAAASTLASAQGISLNEFIVQAVTEATHKA
ncbi:type II toxin-antitoxin system HicB family antitoxin [Entomobacter blattae]|uniref:HicB family protein n=1 Tax=Entomobacter blattae TaxID=2762277 RepID=A0A7H1NTT1_9PROT|nr:type II toxin-antitoxin system HicB family antitoxin [Entomobacter blattae]QNT79191.1 HicB family protein [Entomobacter blattae]